MGTTKKNGYIESYEVDTTRPKRGRPKGSTNKKPKKKESRTTRRLFSFRIEKKLADYIDRHKNRTDFIHRCIAFAYDYDEARHDADMLSRMGFAYPAAEVRSMPMYFFDNARFVAGFPVALDNDEMAQQVELMHLICPHPESSYLIRVAGDSMIDAGIHSGDMLIVDKSNRNPDEHEAAVCELNGEYTIKHVVREHGKVWLIPANKNFPCIEVKEHDDFSIWGVVAYTIHKPKS